MSSITRLDDQPELGTELVRITKPIRHDPVLRVYANATKMIALAQSESPETFRLMNATTIEKCKMKIIRILMERGFVLETRKAGAYVNLNLLEFINALNKTWEKNFRKNEIVIIDKQLVRRTFELLTSPGDDYSTSLTLVHQNLDTWKEEIAQKRIFLLEHLVQDKHRDYPELADLILSFTGDQQIKNAIKKHQAENAKQASKSSEIAPHPISGRTFLALLLATSSFFIIMAWSLNPS